MLAELVECIYCSRAIGPGQVAILDWTGLPAHPACADPNLLAPLPPRRSDVIFGVLAITLLGVACAAFIACGFLLIRWGC